MGRKRKGPEVATEDAQVQPDEETNEGPEELTAYELARQQLIQRNRERLAELGIPGLVAKLEQGAGAGAAKPKKKKPKAARAKAPRPKREAGAEEEQPVRRSSRIQQQHMTEAEKFEAELGQVVAEGRCGRCGAEVEAGEARAHLEGCEGPPEPERPPPRPRRTDVEMTEEERQDVRKRTLARMKQLSLENLVDFTAEQARFVVLGSTGNHYVVTLADDKCKCECMDYRFRRHHCKHICLALSHLGILDEPHKWQQAVEAKLSDLVKQEQQQAGAWPPTERAPLGKMGEVALKFL